VVINDRIASILNAKYSVLDYLKTDPTVPHRLK